LCAGIDRCEGVQVCLEDGSGYGPCDCSDPPREVNGETPEPDGTNLYIGRACAEDAECGTGLSCIPSSSNDFFGGGPAHGYCSAVCTSDADCQALDSWGECFGEEAGTGICTRVCFSQNAPASETKCLGRRDTVCASEAFLGLAEYSGSRQKGWCLPQCGSDEDCEGRRCDLARGVCTDTAPEGLPIGARCDGADQCSGGRCVAFGPDQGFCSALCVLGQPVGCGYGLSADPREAGCVRPLLSGFLSSEGVGDVGFCGELCNVDADCTQVDRGWFCLEIENGPATIGGFGYCFPPDATADAGADATPDGSATPDGCVLEGG
jgi:hypothetical protein